MLERTVEISILYDYYGKLLTERQQQVVKLYYFHDLSLSEVSQKLDISRQGVHDHLHRAEKMLHQYENQLQLVKKFREFQKNLNELYNYVDDSLLQEENKKIKTKILSKIDELKQEI